MADASEANVGIAILLAVIATFGVIFNGFGMVIVKNNPILNNSFGQLCFSHSIANLGVCSAFLLWAAPMTLTQNVDLATGNFGKIVGQINIFFWDVCVYSHLALSFNRFLTIAFPLKTIYWMTPLRQKIGVIIPWILGACHIVPYFWYKECYICFHPKTWTWDFAATNCGKIISKYFDMYTGFAVLTIMTLLDLSTLYFLHQNHNFVGEVVFQDRKTAEVMEMAKARRKVEIKFFIQSLIQGGIFFYELSNFYIITNLNANQYFIFFTSTFAWLICHMLDGVVLTCFHVGSYRRNRSRTTGSTTRLFIKT